MSMISRSLSVSSDLKAASQYSQWLPELTERADRERKRERERASEKRERERERERDVRPTGALAYKRGERLGKSIIAAIAH
jgi:Ni/Co efflux regulator RcnB